MTKTAAAFNVYFDFGGSDGSPGTEQNIDSLGPPTLRFKDADDATIDTNNPIQIPAAGTNYSRYKHVYLKCSTAPNTQVDNIKVYTDGGGFGTGITVKIGSQFPTKNSGSDAGYEVSDASTEMVADHSGLSASSDLFGYTSGSPLSGPTISESGSVIDAIGETTNYIVLQMEVASTASSGNLTDETVTFQYDEI